MSMPTSRSLDTQQRCTGRDHLLPAAQEGAGAAGAVDWRAYAESHALTDKQAKLAQKLRRREARMQNLQREADKIRVRRLSRLAPSCLCMPCLLPHPPVWTLRVTAC